MMLDNNNFRRALGQYRVDMDNLTLFTKGCIIYSKCMQFNSDKDLEKLIVDAANLKTVTEDDEILKDKLKDAIWRRLGC